MRTSQQLRCLSFFGSDSRQTAILWGKDLGKQEETKMEQKFRKASFVMEPYIEGVLKRDLIPYQRRHKGDHAEFGIAISNRRFREVVEDASVRSRRQKVTAASRCIPCAQSGTGRNGPAWPHCMAGTGSAS